MILFWIIYKMKIISIRIILYEKTKFSKYYYYETLTVFSNKFLDSLDTFINETNHKKIINLIFGENKQFHFQQNSF